MYNQELDSKKPLERYVYVYYILAVRNFKSPTVRKTGFYSSLEDSVVIDSAIH